MYKSNSSVNANDFLLRLYYLIIGGFKVLETDNGSEFLKMGNYIADTEVFNKLLTEWLIEYNLNRAHQSLGYATPIEILEQKLSKNQNQKVLPMYPIRANS